MAQKDILHLSKTWISDGTGEVMIDDKVKDLQAL